MLRLSALSLACAFLIAGCDSSKSSETPSKTAAPASTSAAKPAPPTGAAPTEAAGEKPAPVMAAEAFYAEYTGETDVMKKLERYEKGVTVTDATISSTQDTSTQVIALVKFDDKRSLRLNFADKNAVKKGDTISATCQINGDANGEIYLAACTKK